MKVLWLLPFIVLASACATAPAVNPEPGTEDRYVVVTLHNATHRPAARAGSSPRDYGAGSSYSVAPQTQLAARTLARRHALESISEWPIPALGVHCIVYRITQDQAQATVLDRLRRDPLVESAQPLHTFSSLTGEYNDPYFELQRNLPMIGVPQAHRYSRGERVRVAVIDTHVDTKHPDLATRALQSRDFTGLKPSPARHGTAVAGIISATVNNALGIVGIAPDADVHVLSACWRATDQSALAVCNTLTLAKALVAAIGLNARVVNLSLGGPSDPLLRRLVEHGLSKGMIFVCALPPSGATGFPCDVNGVISVDRVGSSNTSAMLLAPGMEILTLVPGGGYDFLSGSSLAAAHVSASIALLLARDPKLSATEVRTALAQTAPQGESINICAALADVASRAQCRLDARPDDPTTGTSASTDEVSAAKSGR